MENIFIVKNVVGQYDEQTERSLCAVTTEKKAATLVKQFIELNKFNCAFNKRMLSEFKSVWESNNPKPEAPDKPNVPDGFHELQRELSEKSRNPHSTPDLTPLKKLFRELQNKHHSNLRIFDTKIEAYHEAFKSYHDGMVVAHQEWFDKNYIIPSHLKEVADIAGKENHSPDSGNEYTYYKLGVIH